MYVRRERHGPCSAGQRQFPEPQGRILGQDKKLKIAILHS
jgi:hypothetical protein